MLVSFMLAQVILVLVIFVADKADIVTGVIVDMVLISAVMSKRALTAVAVWGHY